MLKLTNKQLDLASSFERWQKNFGKVIPENNSIKDKKNKEQTNLIKSKNLKP